MKHLLFFLLSLALLGKSSVIGIDLGLDWFKVSIVKQGIPLDIVLNKESKRKTSTSLTIHRNTRIYGGSIKHPSKTYPALKNLLGVHRLHPRALAYRQAYHNNMGEQGDVVTFSIDQDEYRVEHLAAMVLAHAKSQAEAHGKEIVTGAVLVVPPYFNQFERQALLDACDLASLRVIQLINDETAVALNYAMLRQFTNTTQHHVFYDMGAGSTVASLVSFRNVDMADGKRKKSVAQIQVLATGYEDTLGGTLIDQKTLDDLLIPKFLEQHPTVKIADLKADSVAISRLRREANRVKQVLSANTETYASAESLHKDLDFKALVKREELESVCGSEMKRVTAPIKRILELSGLKVAEIDSVVLVGGGVRMPMVQDALESFVGKDKIARNVNGDEAAVLGAGFRAATISTLFRVREILVKDKNMEDVEVSYDVESGDRTIKTLIFTQNTLLGVKKLMTFKCTTDFSFTLSYKNGAIPIMTAKVHGVEAAFKNLTDTTLAAGKKFLKGPAVKAVLKVDESGMFSVGEVYLWAEVTGGKVGGDSISDSIKSFFGSSKDEKKVEDKNEDAEKETENIGADAEKKESAAGPIPTPKSEDKKKNAIAALLVIEEISLKVDLKPETVMPLTDSEKQDIKARIHAMDAKDAEVRAQEEALNTLESLIYAIKYSLDEDDVMAVSTEADRDALSVAYTAAQEWLEENYAAKTSEINARHASLHSSWKDVAFRKSELSERPTAVEDLTKYIGTSRELVAQTQANQTKMEKSEVKVYLEIPEKEFGIVGGFIDEVSSWLDGVLKQQESLKGWEKAAFTSSDCREKMSYVKKKVNNFLKAKKWKYIAVEKPTTTKTVKAADSTEDAQDGSDEETVDSGGGEDVKEGDLHADEESVEEASTADGGEGDKEAPAEAPHDEL